MARARRNPPAPAPAPAPGPAPAPVPANPPAPPTAGPPPVPLTPATATPPPGGGVTPTTPRPGVLDMLRRTFQMVGIVAVVAAIGFLIYHFSPGKTGQVKALLAEQSASQEKKTEMPQLVPPANVAKSVAERKEEVVTAPSAPAPASQPALSPASPAEPLARVSRSPTLRRPRALAVQMPSIVVRDAGRPSPYEQPGAPVIDGGAQVPPSLPQAPQAAAGPQTLTEGASTKERRQELAWLFGQNPDINVRISAARELAKPELASYALAKQVFEPALSTSQNRMLRETAAWWLGEAADNQSLDALTAAVSNDPSEEVRAAAKTAIDRINSRGGRPASRTTTTRPAP